MIINFDRSPEEYYRLSRIALDEGEPDRALTYGLKAARGKGTTEYKLSLAEIFLRMGRYPEAMDMALEALCYGRGFRAEIYDVLARATSEMGDFYDSLHYIALKAQVEGDEEALDAMDEMMEEFEADNADPSKDFYVVGKERKEQAPVSLMRATMCLHEGKWRDALSLLSEIGEDSEYYGEALIQKIRAYVVGGALDEAATTAEEAVRRDPKKAYPLYVLTERCRRKEYLPLLAGVEGSRQELTCAIEAAASLNADEIATALADKLVSENPYSPEAHFTAAAVYLNGGERAKSVDHMKRLFAVCPKYPSAPILAGWARLKKCSVTFSGAMPKEIAAILKRYVKARSKGVDAFVRSMLTDDDFRASVALLFENDEHVATKNLLYYLGMANERQVDAFFAKLLIRIGVDPFLKRAILAELIYHKDKGKIPLVPVGVPTFVSCAKPKNYESYPMCLKIAYINLRTFFVCLTGESVEEALEDLAERAFTLQGIEKENYVTVGGAILLRILYDMDDLPTTGPKSEEESCRTIMREIFGAERLPMAKIKRLHLSLF